MPYYKVTRTITTYLTHIIKADTEEHALNKMKSPFRNPSGKLIDIIEDDSVAQYEITEVENLSKTDYPCWEPVENKNQNKD